MKIIVRHPSTLLEYLYEALVPQSRTSIRSLLAHSGISVNGQITTAFDHPLAEGDCIMTGAARKEKQIDRRLKIVYEDRWLIVADKTNGLPAISTGKENEVTAYSILYDYVRSSGDGGRIFIVHRLDRDTSGIMVFAKDESTKRLLQENWNEAVTERKYTGVAEGRLPETDGEIVSWLKENPKSLKMSAVPYDNGGKKAVTAYHLAGFRKGLSLVEITLETGRKNQIRVQFAAIGHPIAGDKKYGAQTNPFGRLALHASVLEFRHPHTGKTMRFVSPAPFRL